VTYAADNRRWLEPYIREMAQRMNLPQWRVDLSDDEPEDGSTAQVHIQGQGRIARVLLRDPHGDMDDLRDSVVHELLHLHIHDMETVIHQTEQHFNPAAYDIVTRMYREQMEIAVCAIARAWSSCLPLPNPRKRRAI